MLQSYSEEIDEFVKYIAQPYKFPVWKKMIEPRYGQQPENEILREKKKVGVPHNFNMGGTYYPDIQRSLYDQGCRIDLDGSKRLEI